MSDDAMTAQPGLLGDVDSPFDPAVLAAATARLIAKYTDRPCKGCGKAKVRGKYVNCADCRSKNREKEDLKRAMRIARMKAAVLQNAEGNIPTVEGASGSSSPPPYTKKAKTSKEKSVQVRPSKYLKDMKGEEREVAMRMMKSHVTRLVKRKAVDPWVLPASKPESGTEYIDSASLYSALKECLEKSTKVSFKGFHIIVASDDEDHKEKVNAVANDLRKIARVPFNPEEPILKQRTRNETMRNATYECTCLGFAAPPPPVSSTPSSRPHAKKPKLSSSGGNLMDYMREMQRAKAQEEEERERKRVLEKAAGGGEKRRVECGGKVKVQAQEDRSHPCGILGQKITVIVEHQ